MTADTKEACGIESAFNQNIHLTSDSSSIYMASGSEPINVSTGKLVDGRLADTGLSTEPDSASRSQGSSSSSCSPSSSSSPMSSSLSEEAESQFSSTHSDMASTPAAPISPAPTEDVQKETLDDEPRSIIFGLLSQLRRGTDLSRVTLPTFVLEPRSLLERVTDFMSHPHLLLHAHLEDDPVRRFIEVLRYYLSGWHIRPKGVKKPYNPVLGEFYRCDWVVPADPRTLDLQFDPMHPSYEPMASKSTLSLRRTLHGSPSSELLGASLQQSTHSLPPAARNVSVDSFDSAQSKASSSEAVTEASAHPYFSLPAVMPAPHYANPLRPWCPYCEAASDSAQSSSSYYFAEQVSHHPPISAYFYCNPRHHTIITGNFRPKSKFLGNSGASLMHGTTHLCFTNRPGEEYIFTNPNIYIRGIFIGSMLTELGDSVTIECPATGLVADIEFKVKGFIMGTYNAIQGKIRDTKTGHALYSISGKWTDKISITPIHPRVQPTKPASHSGKDKKCASSSSEPVVLLDVNELPIVSKRVMPESHQHPFESRRLWSKVTQAILARDMNTATVEKTAIEDRQRAATKAAIAASKKKTAAAKVDKGKAGAQGSEEGAYDDHEDEEHQHAIPWSSRFFCTDDGIRWSFKKDIGAMTIDAMESFLKELSSSTDPRVDDNKVKKGSESVEELSSSLANAHVAVDASTGSDV